MCAGSPESQSSPGLHPKQRGRQGEGGDSAPLLRSGETPPEHCAQLGGPQHKPGRDLLERGRGRDTELVRGLEALCCGERLGELGGLSPEQRRLRGDLAAATRCLQGL